MKLFHRFHSSAAWILAALLATFPAPSFARDGRGGGGHTGGGRIGGGHMGGGRIGGGQIGGGRIGGFGGGGQIRSFGGGNIGGGQIRSFDRGNIGGGQIRGFDRGNIGGGQIRGFNRGNIGGGQIRSFDRGNIGGGQIRGLRSPNFGSSMGRGEIGGQGLVHHGVNLQPGHRFQAGQGFQLGAGRSHGISITPNHALYGRGLSSNVGRMGQGLQSGGRADTGAGALARSAGRPVHFGNGGINRIGGGGIGNHRIGGMNRPASHSVGGVGYGGHGDHRSGRNVAQFYGGRGHDGHGHDGRGHDGRGHGAWGLGGPYGGYGHDQWHAGYRNVVVNYNYYYGDWYNGPWGGYWGFGWGYPYYGSAFVWGLGPYFSPWWGYGGYGLYGGYGGYYGYGGPYYGGYGYDAYYNPYCAYPALGTYVSTLGTGYYAQPVSMPLVVDEPTVTVDANKEAAFRLVEAGRKLFLAGDYQGALEKYDEAIPNLKDDPIVHELRALALFALGDYHEAAATLNALLAVAPGMDWQSMRNQYPDVATYTKQLRALEQFLRDHPDDAAARFVLGYHYLVTSFPDAAAKQFQKVVELEPRDAVAKKLIESLTKDQKASPAEAAPPAAANGAPPQTELVGRWQAKGEDGSRFDLTLNQDGHFTWVVTPPKGNVVKQTGTYTATSDRLILDSEGQENTLMARVESRGPDHFRFWITDDASLPFRREGVDTPEPAATAKPDASETTPDTPIPPRKVPPAATAPENGSEDGLPPLELPSPRDEPADAVPGK